MLSDFFDIFSQQIQVITIIPDHQIKGTLIILIKKSYFQKNLQTQTKLMKIICKSGVNLVQVRGLVNTTLFTFFSMFFIIFPIYRRSGEYRQTGGGGMENKQVYFFNYQRHFARIDLDINHRYKIKMISQFAHFFLHLSLWQNSIGSMPCALQAYVKKTDQ